MVSGGGEMSRGLLWRRIEEGPVVGGGIVEASLSLGSEGRLV